MSASWFRSHHVPLRSGSRNGFDDLADVGKGVTIACQNLATRSSSVTFDCTNRDR